jgi:tetratricopeptide (TPR) repeat protein
LAYQPFVEAIGHYVSTCEREILDRHVAVFGGELTRIVSELPYRVAGVPEPLRADPGLERHRLFEAVAHLVLLAGDAGGVVMILDDLHWADKGTLLLLRHLLRTGKPRALLLIGTYRDTDLARTHPLAEMLADFRGDDDVERLMLSGLDVAGVEAFVEASAGQPLSDDGMSLAQAVRDQTEGNPFFVGQVLRHLAETGAVFQRDGQWAFDGDVSHLGIPEGAREVIGHRLTRLPDEVNGILRTAAVIGREFDLRLVAQVDGLSEDDVVEALEAAVEARLVAEAPTADHFMFAHALVRESLYSELSSARRARLHRRVGEAIEARHAGNLQPHLAQLAHHFFLASPGSVDEKAVSYLVEAGHRATALLSFEEAASHFERALDAVEAGGAPGIERGELLLALGDAHYRAGDVEKARAVFRQATEEAAENGRAAHLARAALGFGGAGVTGIWVTVGMIDEELVALLDRALEALGGEDSPWRARILGRLATELYFSDARERRDELSTDAVAIARRLDDPTALLAALNSRHWAVWDVANLDDRLAIANEMVEVAERFDNREMALTARTWRIVDLLELGDIDRVVSEIDEHAVLAQELRQPGYLWRSLCFQAMRELLAGRFAEGERLAVEAVGIGQRVESQGALQQFGSQMVVILRDQGRLGELEPVIRGFSDQYRAIPGWQAALAYLYSHLGRTDDARDAFEALAASDFTALPRDGQWLVSVVLLADACAFLGDAARADTLYDMLLPYAGRNVVAGFGLACSGSASRHLGLLATTMGRLDAAAAHFEDALVMNARIGARPWVANTELDYGRVLAARGGPRDRSRAAELAANALATAEELGMTELAERARLLTTKVDVDGH